MTKEQYRKANGTVYPVIMILMAYILLVTLGVISNKGMQTRTIVQAVVAIVAMVTATCGFAVKREHKSGTTIILSSVSVAYFVIMLVNDAPNTYVYAIPVLFATMVYFSTKYVFYGNVVTLISAGIHLARTYAEGKSTIDDVVIAVFILVLVAMISYGVMKALILFNKQNMSTIQAASEEQKRSNETMVKVADNVIMNFDAADSMIGSLKQNIDTNNFAMKNIADSSESTAEAIQQQLIMCNEIQENVKNAQEETGAMIKAAKETTTTVNDGVEAVTQLQKQADMVKKASRITVESTEKLTARIEDVQNFVGAILEISSQTNLLALNASIEAARAGEAGKGFAVVADQIRQLSEQTKDASNKITDIIEELNVDADQATKSIQDSVDSVVEQNKMITVTKDKFTGINENVGSLNALIDSTDAIMKKITESTNVIVENISQLSASSEEVAASSNEGYKTSENAVQAMEEFKKALDSIYENTQELKKATN